MAKTRLKRPEPGAAMALAERTLAALDEAEDWLQQARVLWTADTVAPRRMRELCDGGKVPLRYRTCRNLIETYEAVKDLTPRYDKLLLAVGHTKLRHAAPLIGSVAGDHAATRALLEDLAGMRLLEVDDRVMTETGETVGAKVGSHGAHFTGLSDEQRKAYERLLDLMGAKRTGGDSPRLLDPPGTFQEIVRLATKAARAESKKPTKPARARKQA